MGAVRAFWDLIMSYSSRLEACSGSSSFAHAGTLIEHVLIVFMSMYELRSRIVCMRRVRIRYVKHPRV